jgi:hypothetical protein
MGLIQLSGGTTKPFPRNGAYCHLKPTGEVGIVHQYPQQNGGGADEDGSPIVTFDPATAEVHVLNDDGTTRAEYRNVPISEIRQAKLKEIPTKRRPTAAQAKKYGYE